MATTYIPGLRLSREEELTVLRRLHVLENDLNASVKAEAAKAEAPKAKGSKGDEKATSSAAAAATPEYQRGHYHYQDCANDTAERKGIHDCACRGNIYTFEKANAYRVPPT